MTHIQEIGVMKKTFLAGLSVFLLIGGLSYGNLFFKMTAEKTNLLVNEEVTVTLHAWANDVAATDENGLNAWSLDVFVDSGGIVEVVEGSIEFLAPSPWWWATWNSINSPSGAIEYLNLAANFEQGSETGVDGYSEIARFKIAAIGQPNQSVTYSLGDGELGFEGILADDTYLTGVFDSANSQTIFTIVPEPSSLLIFSGLGIMGFFRRSRK